MGVVLAGDILERLFWGEPRLGVEGDTPKLSKASPKSRSSFGNGKKSTERAGSKVLPLAAPSDTLGSELKDDSVVMGSEAVEGADDVENKSAVANGLASFESRKAARKGLRYGNDDVGGEFVKVDNSGSVESFPCSTFFKLSCEADLVCRGEGDLAGTAEPGSDDETVDGLGIGGKSLDGNRCRGGTVFCGWLSAEWVLFNLGGAGYSDRSTPKLLLPPSSVDSRAAFSLKGETEFGVSDLDPNDIGEPSLGAVEGRLNMACSRSWAPEGRGGVSARSFPFPLAPRWNRAFKAPEDFLSDNPELFLSFASSEGDVFAEDP